MTNPETTDSNERGFILKVGAQGVLAGIVSVTFALDSLRVLALAPIVHSAAGDESYSLPPEYIASAGVEAVIAIGSAAYAVKRYRSNSTDK